MLGLARQNYIADVMHIKLIKELIIQNNQLTEVRLYSPISGILYASTLLKRDINEVNQELNILIADAPVEVIVISK